MNKIRIAYGIVADDGDIVHFSMVMNSATLIEKTGMRRGQFEAFVKHTRPHYVFPLPNKPFEKIEGWYTFEPAINGGWIPDRYVLNELLDTNIE